MNNYQIELMKIYNEFSKLCLDNNLEYFAAGGTLLGAVRHKGFIPWDDDMDIYMFRKDYEKLKKISQEFVSAKILIQNNMTDKEWYWPYTKIRLKNTTAIEYGYEKARFYQGVWIDVFPIDLFIDDNVELKKYEKKRKELIRRINIHYGRKAKFKGRVYDCYILVKYPFLKQAYRKLENLAIKYNNNPEANFYSTIWDEKINKKVFFNKEYFKDFVKVPFENDIISIPSEFDAVLSSQYGNWRVIPPENDRKSGHQISTIDLKVDFKDYLDLNNL